MSTNKIWAFLGDHLISGATIIGGAIVLILSIANITNTAVTMQAILALLVLLATSEIVERNRRLDSIIYEISQITKGQTDTKVFDDVDEHYRFLTERISLAKSTIDIVNFRPSLPRNPISRQQYSQVIEERILNSPIRVRRVVIPYDTKTISWIKDALNKFNGHNFWVGYFHKPPEYIPALNMLLIDAHEAFVGGFYQLGQFDERGTVWLSDPHIAKALQDYYNYLWNKAHLLNPNEIIQEEELNELEKSLQ